MRLLVMLACLAFVAAPRAQQPVFGERLAAAASAQVGVTTRYDPAYVRLDYPGGDVPVDRGVCTDVIVRAYRALGIDLQQRVHEDMRSAWAKYPKAWALKRPDPNIDHRRVPNLQVYFARHGEALPVSRDEGDYQVGDLVTWRLPSGVPHIGIVAVAREGAPPLIAHNIGAGAQVEDMLFEFTVTGHYRYAPEDAR